MAKVSRSVCIAPFFASQIELTKRLAKCGGYPSLVFGGERDNGRATVKSRFIASLISSLIAIIVTWPNEAIAGSFAYVSLDGENKIVVYAVNELDGTLTRASETQIEGSAGPLCASPDRRFLFSSVRSAGKLAAFHISPNDGSLSIVNIVSAGVNPAYVTTDRTGQHLLTAYYTEGKITSHTIDKDGCISAKATQELPTADKAHAIMTDRENSFAYVPHTGPNTIFQFRFNEKNGRFTALNPKRVNTGKNTGPRQLALHPKLDVAYFAYEQGSAIAVFNVDRKSGRITFRERLSTLPKSYLGKNSNARIEITPNGRFIYVANRGHNSLAGFAADPKTGALSKIGITLTEAVPRGFNIDPTGRHLYAAGQASGNLAAFKIGQKTGELKRFATYEVGERPWWVLVVKTD